MTPQASKVLLVSDSAELANRLFNILDGQSHFDLSITLVSSIDEALDLAITCNFALIATDSLSNTQKITRIIDVSGDIPTLFFTPSPQKDTFELAFKLGISDVFDLSQLDDEHARLESSLQRLMKRSRVMRDHTYLHHELIQSLEELEADQQAAFHIQQNMMPPETMQCGAITAQHLVSPSLYLSGDYVDVEEMDKRHTAFLLADVSGHGASSALVTVLLKNMMQSVVRNYQDHPQLPDLPALLKQLNQELLDTRVGKHLTLFLAIIDQEAQQMHYVSGGHRPLPVLTDTQGHRFLEASGSAIGLFPSPKFTAHSVNLSGEFQVTVCSDGLLELIDTPKMLDKEKILLSAIKATLGEPPLALKELVGADFSGSQPDDIAIVNLRGNLE